MITILLFYNIPKQLETDLFDPGILLFIIITTSLLMTFALVWDKNRSIKAIKKATDVPVGFTNWKAPDIEEIGK